MNGKDWRPSRSIPKLLLLMKTNFYLVGFKLSKGVPKFTRFDQPVSLLILRRRSEKITPQWKF